MLETVEKKVPRKEGIRLVGGGAQSNTWGQILADVTGRTIEVTEHPENAGAAGAALVCGVGLGAIRFDDVKRIVHVAKTFTPRTQYQTLYDKHYHIFKQLHRQNKKLFKVLNT
jgi:xylulokinase